MTRKEKEYRVSELLQFFWENNKNIFHIAYWKYKDLDLQNLDTLSDADLDRVVVDLEDAFESLDK